MKHKHYEVITQYYADTSQVLQVIRVGDKHWTDFPKDENPSWYPAREYRIKPSIPKSGLTDNQLVSKYYSGGPVKADSYEEYQAWRRIADAAIVQAVESGIVKIVEA